MPNLLLLELGHEVLVETDEETAGPDDHYEGEEDGGEDDPWVLTRQHHSGDTGVETRPRSADQLLLILGLPHTALGLPHCSQLQSRGVSSI